MIQHISKKLNSWTKLSLTEAARVGNANYFKKLLMLLKQQELVIHIISLWKCHKITNHKFNKHLWVVDKNKEELVKLNLHFKSYSSTYSNFAIRWGNSNFGHWKWTLGAIKFRKLQKRKNWNSCCTQISNSDECWHNSCF